MENTMERDIQEAIAASDMYQLLSMSLHLPTQEIAAGLLDGSLAEDVLAILGELDFSLETIEKFRTNFLEIQNNKQTQEELLSKMRQEYTRLFSHPKEPEVAIYETLFRYDPENDEGKPSLFISPAALDAERCYKKAGLVMSKELNEPGDHMATEMEFMMYLYLQKAKALQENKSDELSRREAEIKEFTDLHLRKWAKEFFDLCSTESSSEVYRVFGQIGSSFMAKILAR
jgi:TorA maturation chaperone TorD